MGKFTPSAAELQAAWDEYTWGHRNEPEETPRIAAHDYEGAIARHDATVLRQAVDDLRGAMDGDGLIFESRESHRLFAALRARADRIEATS